jgi:hypothetical protein
MNKVQIYRLLSYHLKLSERRNPMFERNRAAKYIIYFMVAFWALYLIFLAVIFFLAAKDSDDTTGYELVGGGFAPFILFIDFTIRFMMTQTPAQQVKPYALLPLPKFACIDCFLVNSLLNKYNLFWFFLFVPFAFLSVLFSEGFFPFVGFLVGWWLLMLVNSQWYLLVRTLVNNNLLWWLLPVFVYATIALPWMLGAHHGFEHFMMFYSNIGRWMTLWNPIWYISILAALTLLFLINRKMQYAFVYKELSKVEQVKLKKVTQFKFFDQFGIIGQFMKLEIKSIMRCKTIRTRFIQSICVVIMFSLILSFSDIYDNTFMTNFICIYNFAIFGAMTLSQIMGAEGNYMDGLMVHKENILALLRAKYFLNCMMMVFPLLLMIPTIMTGKVTLLMTFTYMFMTTGPIYFVFFQMAVYNKQTIPLNDKIIGKGNTNSFVQTVIVLCAFFIPLLIFYVLTSACGLTIGLCIMLVLGILVTLLNSLWIRNIYNRLMIRRYENMDGFRMSR